MFREPCGDRGHEGVPHAGTGAMGEHVACAGLRRRLQQPGNVNVVIAGNGDRLGTGRRHRALSVLSAIITDDDQRSNK
jgi:hypothetical protein